MTKAIKVYDYRQCELPDILFEIKINQKDIDEKVFKAAEHFLTLEEQTGEIKKGDIAAIKIESEDKFISSECERLSVGKGYHAQEIEDALPGKKKGDVFNVTVEGTPAKITVLWDVRRIVPELDDSMAAKLGIEDVTTKDEYISYVTSELEAEEKEKKNNAIWLIVSRKVLENSEFEMDEAEVENQYKNDIAYLKSELEDDYEEFMQVKYHGKTIAESEENYKKEIIKTMKLCAIAEPMAAEDGIEWTEEEYETVIAEMVSEEYSEEEIKQSMSFEDYVKQQKEDYLREKILEYFDERFKTTITNAELLK